MAPAYRVMHFSRVDPKLMCCSKYLVPQSIAQQHRQQLEETPRTFSELQATGVGFTSGKIIRPHLLLRCLGHTPVASGQRAQASCAYAVLFWVTIATRAAISAIAGPTASSSFV